MAKTVAKGLREPGRSAVAVVTLLISLALMLAVPSVASAAPANDNFANAQVISGSTASVNGTTAGATREQGEPDHLNSDIFWEGDHSVWYRWTAPDTGPTTIDTCTANIDSILAVYSGSQLAALSKVVEDNNACGPPGSWGSRVTFNAQAGTTYQIAVGDAGGLRENTFTLKVASRTLVVSNTNDSGAGSLRQAILDANATAGLDEIRFDISGSGPHTIAPTSAFPTITDPVIVDGTTEPDFAGQPIIELSGAGAGDVDGLTINAGGSTVRGLVINRFVGSVASGGRSGILLTTKGGNVIEGNYIGTDADGTQARGNWFGVRTVDSSDDVVGGTTAAKRNVISGNTGAGLNITGNSDGNDVQGNYVGTDASGTASLGNGSGVVLQNGTDNNVVGGTVAGSRNVISGNGTNGNVLINGNATGNSVQGNYIGTDKTGTQDLGNSGNGVDIVNGASDNTIGGTTPAARNVISGNGFGVAINAFFGVPSSNNQVIGNYIGTDATGTKDVGNSSHGIGLFKPGNKIGGAQAGAGNRLAFNGEDGVAVAPDPANTGNAILRNSIFSNGKLGIDLDADGVNANDSGDADTGANEVQNFPVITSAKASRRGIAIKGTLNSNPGETFTVQFFANPSGTDEGKTFLGEKKSVTTDASGNASFSLRVRRASGVVTATATDASGNTSEFSAPKKVVRR